MYDADAFTRRSIPNLGPPEPAPLSDKTFSITPRQALSTQLYRWEGSQVTQSGRNSYCEDFSTEAAEEHVCLGFGHIQCQGIRLAYCTVAPESMRKNQHRETKLVITDIVGAIRFEVTALSAVHGYLVFTAGKNPGKTHVFDAGNTLYTPSTQQPRFE